MPAAPDLSTTTAETHMSWLFFTPDRAYKRLKPVAMPFIDHTGVSQRIASIDREFELNHAISPDVYLGTADVHEHGELVDRMLVMRRLPEARRLSNLVGTPDFDTQLRAVAKSIATLHAERAPVLDAPMAEHAAVARNWADNIAVFREHIGATFSEDDVDRVEQLVGRYLDRREVLFADRISGGWVRDVHGDLIADDIYCLDDGPRLIDCLAFNDRWRIVDVLADIAFLVMDIHRLAGATAAERLMAWYHEFSNEQHPASLAHHYVAYRASVRAKVACLRAAQGDHASHSIAGAYLRLVLDHLERARLRVIMVGGGPGTGKSTLARQLGEHFGYAVLSSDEVRKDVTATPRDEHHFAAVGGDIYQPGVNRQTHDELRREADLLLRNGCGVILDATWRDPCDREAVRQLAQRRGAELVELRCTLDTETAKARVRHRLADPTDPGSISDATPELIDTLAAQPFHWPEATEIATDGRAEQAKQRAARACSVDTPPRRETAPTKETP
ncbi:MAG: AAA family ATPase [Acidimicrobiales bacterium]|nr:AAA family ATPase [Acidimicrobiales bacterium]